MSEAIEKIDGPYIGGIPAVHVMKAWDRLEPLLKRVVREHTGTTPEHVLTELQLGHMQVWVVNDFQAIAITKILVKPLHKVLFIPFVAGEHMDEWLPQLGDLLAEYGKAQECAAIEFEGRKGWGKINKHFPEYKPMTVTYRREL